VKEIKLILIPNNLSDFLGIKKFKFGELETEDKVGVATGLAWTEHGGEILKIETVHMPGKGKMQITGKLGEVMQESVKAAKSYVRSKSLDYWYHSTSVRKKRFSYSRPRRCHSKRWTIGRYWNGNSLSVSSITGIPVKKDTAMTGEVTLTGQVIPIGGLKEKLLAAHRAGIKKVLIPRDNEKDLPEIPKKIIDEVEIILVSSVDEVLKNALTKELKPVNWVEVDTLPKTGKDDKAQTQTH
jgi:ATP-dependent Lon protease